MDWNYYLGRKYDLLQQNANADTSRAASLGLTSAAQANLNNVQAHLMPAESAANVGLTNAQAMLAKSNAANVDVSTQWMPRLNQSSIALNSANIGNINANTGLTGANTVATTQRTGMNVDLQDYLKGLPTAQRNLAIGQQFRFGAYGN